MAFKTGDRVRVVSREVTAEDVKSRLYYAYFGGLTGSVDRVYDDGSVCIDVDLESLRDDQRERHLQIQEMERKQWLESLSDEVRGRLTAEQKKLRISYKILVSDKDIEPCKGDKPTNKSESASKREAPTAASEEVALPKAAARGTPDEPESVRPTGSRDAEAARRRSEAELLAAEEEYLRSLNENPE
jgi:hypothetical protein